MQAWAPQPYVRILNARFRTRTPLTGSTRTSLSDSGCVGGPTHLTRSHIASVVAAGAFDRAASLTSSRKEEKASMRAAVSESDWPDAAPSLKASLSLGPLTKPKTEQMRITKAAALRRSRVCEQRQGEAVAGCRPQPQPPAHRHSCGRTVPCHPISSNPTGGWHRVLWICFKMPLAWLRHQPEVPARPPPRRCLGPRDRRCSCG